MRLPKPAPNELALVQEVIEHREALDDEVHGGLLLGDALTQIRVRSGLSQGQVAERGALSPRRVRAIEAGGEAQADELVCIARALDVSAVGLATLEPGRTVRAMRVISEAKSKGQLVLPGLPGALSWETQPWRLDPMAQGFVADHPDGGTIEEIAAAIGHSTRWVERVLVRALAKLRAALDDE